MREKRKSQWRKLDNAAQAFPAATGKKDTRVFRFYCTLREEVQEGLLQKALDLTLEKYPLFLSVLRKGVFWFYMEPRDIPAKVRPENRPPCSRIYVPDQKKLLFEVTYHKNRINFEVFHGLTDGTGAMNFLKELVRNYLMQAHPGEDFPEVDSGDELTQNDYEEDSFSQYYTGKKKKTAKSKPAFQMKGERLEQEEMEITELTLSAREVHAKAREYGVSVTAFLAAALLYAVYEEVPRSRLKKPVSLMIPVNLRNFFPSESMTNFWSWIETAQTLGENASLEDVVSRMKEAFGKDALREEISCRMNDLVRLEKNPFLRAVPLEIKNLFLMAGTTLGGRSVTAVYSNICRNVVNRLKGQGIACRVEENDFPGYREKPSRAALMGLRIFTFTCTAAVVLCWMLDYLLTPGAWWAGYVTGGVFCTWLLIMVGFRKRKNPLKNGMWQLTIVSAGSVLWDIFTGWLGWSVDYVIPLAALVTLLSMVIVSAACRMEAAEYLFYLAQAGAFGLIPFILLAAGVVSVPYPSVICAGVSLLFLLGLVIFKGKEFVREIKKKFRV